MFIKVSNKIFNNSDNFYLVRTSEENNTIHLVNPFSYFWLKKMDKLKFINSIQTIKFFNNDDISYTIIALEDEFENNFLYEFPLLEKDYMNFIYISLCFEEYLVSRKEESVTNCLEKLVLNAQAFLSFSTICRIVNFILRNEEDKLDKIKLMFTHILKPYIENGEKYGIYN